MRRGNGSWWCAILAGVTLGVLVSGEARADGVEAQPCEDDVLRCATAPISFDRTDALPIEWDFDTGWVPPSPPLQVRLFAGVYANTTVRLAGDLVTTWPDALTLQAPGKPGGGFLDYHYGLEVGAKAKITLDVGFQTFSWEGNLPYVPQIDFQVAGNGQFDAWGWPPGHAIASSTQSQTLATVDLASVIGSNIPGLEGGFSLDVAMDVDVRYVNHRIVIVDADADGMEVSGGPILEKDGETQHDYAGGPSAHFEVHPEGKVHYDGVLHLIPSMYVKLLGQQWTLPLADIPIAFPITESDWAFDPVLVHVPLPDVSAGATVVDFGEVNVGEESMRTLPLDNTGEADAVVALAADDALQFPLWDQVVDVEAGSSLDAAMRFAPQSAGPHETTLVVASNDPDFPHQFVTLKGVGLAVEEEPVAAPAGIVADSSCGCRTAPAPPGRSAALFGLALGALLWRRRRDG